MQRGLVGLVDPDQRRGLPAVGRLVGYIEQAGLGHAAQRALATKAEPGTAQFRAALRDAIATTKEVVGTHGVYNFKAGNLYGVDDRARVIVRVDNGQWKYVP